MRSDGNLLNLVRVLCGVEVFLRAGAKVDAIDSDRWTALHMASFKGNLPIVKVLPSSHSSTHNVVVLFQRLVTSGADVHVTTRLGLLPLHQASLSGRSHVVEVSKISHSDMTWTDFLCLQVSHRVWSGG